MDTSRTAANPPALAALEPAPEASSPADPYQEQREAFARASHRGAAPDAPLLGHQGLPVLGGPRVAPVGAGRPARPRLRAPGGPTASDGPRGTADGKLVTTGTVVSRAADGYRRCVGFRGVWDTGAAISAVNPEVAQACGLEPVGRTTLGTLNGSRQVRVLRADVLLPNALLISGLQVAEAPIPDADILIGMDVIAAGRCNVATTDGKAVLTYQVESGAKVASPAGVQPLSAGPSEGAGEEIEGRGDQGARMGGGGAEPPRVAAVPPGELGGRSALPGVPLGRPMARCGTVCGWEKQPARPSERDAGPTPTGSRKAPGRLEGFGVHGALQ